MALTIQEVYGYIASKTSTNGRIPPYETLDYKCRLAYLNLFKNFICNKRRKSMTERQQRFSFIYCFELLIVKAIHLKKRMEIVTCVKQV